MKPAKVIHFIELLENLSVRNINKVGHCLLPVIKADEEHEENTHGNSKTCLQVDIALNKTTQIW